MCMVCLRCLNPSVYSVLGVLVVPGVSAAVFGGLLFEL